MDELKPCPFCGYKQISNDDAPGTFGENPCRYGCKCPSCTASFWHPECNEINWNTRPIEDALRAEVAALNEELERWKAPLTDDESDAVDELLDGWDALGPIDVHDAIVRVRAVREAGEKT